MPRYHHRRKPRRRQHSRWRVILTPLKVILTIAVVAASWVGWIAFSPVISTISISILEQISPTNVVALEHEVVDQVNAIRVERGLTPLIWDDTLYEYSKKHSQDMADQGDMFHSIGEPYAENCWCGSSGWNAKAIVESWMTSPMGHSVYLLHPHLTHIAVGIVIKKGIVISGNNMYASWTFWASEAWPWAY